MHVVLLRMAALLLLNCLIVVLASNVAELKSSPPPEVATSQATFVGRLLNDDFVIDDDADGAGSSPVESFLGIPFAKPPVGARRFMMPQKPDNNRSDQHVQRADSFAPHCVQPAIGISALNRHNTSEDCLYLNVFRRAGTRRGDLKAVVVLIHGGGFSSGGTSDPYMSGAPLAALGDLVVVSISYRLGIFGFIDTDEGNDTSTNLGLHDQVRALEWVHEHIDDFGGDPGRVTLMGISAGSISIAALVMSPMTRSRGLFHSVIMNTGVISSGVAARSDVTARRIREIARKVDCPTDKNMVDCLRGQDAERLSDLSYDPENYSPIRTFHPTLDGQFLPRRAEADIRENAANYAKVRMMIGYNRDEGSLFVRGQMSSAADPDLTTEAKFLDWCAKLSRLYKFSLNFNSSDVRQTIIDAYLSRYPTKLLAATRFVGDGAYKCPMNAFVDSYSKHNNDNVYMYRFDRMLRDTYFGVDPKKFGVFHFCSHVSLSGSLLSLRHVDAADKQFTRDTVRMVADFARGHEPAFRAVRWPKFDQSRQVLSLSDTPTLLDGLPHEENCRRVFSAYEADLLVRNEL